MATRNCQKVIAPYESPAEILRQLYARKGLNFDAYARVHIDRGFFFSTPEYCVMGRPVCRQWTKEEVFDPTSVAPRAIADAWFCHAMAGDISHVWSILPWPLGWIGFQRFDNVLRWVPTEVIRRFHPASVDEINSQSILST